MKAYRVCTSCAQLEQKSQGNLQPSSRCNQSTGSAAACVAATGQHKKVMCHLAKLSRILVPVLHCLRVPVSGKNGRTSHAYTSKYLCYSPCILDRFRAPLSCLGLPCPGGDPYRRYWTLSKQNWFRYFLILLGVPRTLHTTHDTRCSVATRRREKYGRARGRAAATRFRVVCVCVLFSFLSKFSTNAVSSA